MINRNKKGFTIVELVIVIAVIAILAAVLIPTFAGIIKKANLSSDQQAVRNMNVALAASGDLEGIDAVIDALSENGFNSEKALVPVSKGYKFMWSAAANCIVLLDETGAVVYPTDIEYANDGVDLGESIIYLDVEVKDAASFVEAIANGQRDIKLEADITIENEDLTIKKGDVVTIDLNGKKITTDTYQDGSNTKHRYIKVSGTLTIQNGTFEGRGIMINNGGNLVVKEGTTINAMDADGGACIRNKEGGSVTIEGGTFNVMNNGVVAADGSRYVGIPAIYNEGTAVINGGNFVSEHEHVPYLIEVKKGEVKINGGKFTSYSGVIGLTEGTVTVDGGEFTWNHVEGTTDSQYMFYTGTSGSIVLNKGTFVENNARGTSAVAGDGSFVNNTDTVID